MKKTPNQIREELRRQMAKQHNDEIEYLKMLNNRYWQNFITADKKCCELKQENDELKDKIKQLEDWNNRLMEFMDMSDDDRKAALQEYAETAELNELFNGLYGRLFKQFSFLM